MEGDGVVVQGAAYRVQSIQVDGNDSTLAHYNVIRTGRHIAVSQQKPVLVEVMYVFLPALGK